MGSTKRKLSTALASKSIHRGRLGQKPGAGFGTDRLRRDPVEDDKSTLVTEYLIIYINIFICLFIKYNCLSTC